MNYPPARRLAALAGAGVVLLAVSAPPAAAQGTIATTTLTLKAAEPGLGSDHRGTVNEALDLLEKGKPDDAEALAEKVIAAFEKQMTAPQTKYVSLANKAEVAQFRKDNPKVEKVVWLDAGFG